MSKIFIERDPEMAKLDRLIESVNWESLNHSMGIAVDTPTHLRLLTNPATASSALDALFATVAHQGDHSDAGLYACPILLYLIRNKNLPELDRVLNLILTIGISLDSDIIMSRITLSEHLKRIKIHTRQFPSMNLILKCYRAARKGVSQFIPLTRHSDDSVRWQAMYNLSWFPVESKRTLPLLRNQLYCAREDEPEHLANCILLTGWLEQNCGLRRAGAKSIMRFIDHDNLLIRYSSAVYCSWFALTRSVISVLDQLRCDWDFSGHPDQNRVKFNGGDLTQYAELIWSASVTSEHIE